MIRDPFYEDPMVASKDLRIEDEPVGKKYLIVGCGNSLDKRIRFSSDKGIDSPEEDFSNGGADIWLRNVTTVDHTKEVNPDIVADLNILPYEFGEGYDEIHAYEVLEHCGAQGDAEFFFGQFNEFHRMLKPNGLMMITVPVWNTAVAWGVPDHKRVMPLALFGFLEKDYYENVGKPGYGDYRHLIKGYWEIILWGEQGDALNLVLRKV
jgi:hypothetical protein